MTEVLADLNRLSTTETVYFVYDELEDYRVSCSLRCKTLGEALHEVIGFYPISISESEGKYFVEPQQKTAHKLIGTVVGERGEPLAYANIVLLSLVDSTFLARGVSNMTGCFTIPTDAECALVKVTHVGYRTLQRPLFTTRIGTIHLYPKTEKLPAIQVGKPRQRLKGRERRAARRERKIREMVWSMALPEFEATDIPTAYLGEKAVVLAEYDSIGFTVKHGTPKKTRLHRIRYAVNDPQTASRLGAFLSKKAQEAVGRGSLSVTGLRIVKPDGEETGHDIEAGDIADFFTYEEQDVRREGNTPAASYFEHRCPNLSYRFTAASRPGLLTRYWAHDADLTVTETARKKGLHRISCRLHPDTIGDSRDPRVTVFTSYGQRKGLEANAPRPDAGMLISSSTPSVHGQKGADSPRQDISFGKTSIAESRTYPDTKPVDTLVIPHGEKARMLYETIVRSPANDRLELLICYTDALQRNGIPFTIAHTTPVGREPIDELLTAEEMVTFILLGDGTLCFPTMLMPFGSVPHHLCGRKARLANGIFTSLPDDTFPD